MIQAKSKTVVVRVAAVVGFRQGDDGRSGPILQGAGQDRVRYRDAMLHVGDLKRAVQIALRLVQGSFDVTIQHDDGRALSGHVLSKRTGKVIGLWGTVAPHRDPPENVNRIVIEGGAAP